MGVTSWVRYWVWSTFDLGKNKRCTIKRFNSHVFRYKQTVTERTDVYRSTRFFAPKMFCTVFHPKLYASNVLLYRPCMSIYYLPKHHNFQHGSLVVSAEFCCLATKTLRSGTVYRFVYVTGRNRRSLRKKQTNQHTERSQTAMNTTWTTLCCQI